jgi:hypothetical protein
MDTKSEFQKLKRKVQRTFPNARTMRTKCGGFYVLNENGGVIGIEYLIPPAKSVMEAWATADSLIKIHNNIQRTSPDYMSSEHFEKKFQRISNRNKRKNVL